MSRADDVFDWLKKHPGEWTAREIAVGMYDPPSYEVIQRGFTVYNACVTLEKWGYIQSKDYYIGKKHIVKWSADPWVFPVI